MAQIFPLNVDDLSPEDGRASLAATLAALPDPWTLLRHRRIGDEQAESVEVVLVHPEIGIALVDEAPRDPDSSVRRLREYLDGQRFGEFFQGDLPIVALSIAPDALETSGEQLAAAFEAAPRLSIADADWADAVIELLMVPDDLAMVPVRETPPPAPAETQPADDAHDDIFARPPQREQFFDEPHSDSRDEARDDRFEATRDDRFAEARDERFAERRDDRFDEAHRGDIGGVRRERFDERPSHNPYDREALGQGEPPLPLMVDWPFAASYERKHRRGRVIALVVVLLLLAGGGYAAWEYASNDMAVAINDTNLPSSDAKSRSQIEMPLPPRSSGDNGAEKPATASPPPVPAAPPVVMAQKPLAPPPPAPPTPTKVDPVPQVAVVWPPPKAPSAAATPSPPPAQTATTSPPSPPPTPASPPAQTASAPPAESSPAPAPAAAKPPPAPKTRTAKAEPAPAKPKPAQIAKAEPPVKQTQTAKAEPPAPARREPNTANRGRPIENPDNPPIDAADLPPLDDAPSAPQRYAAPSGSSEPSAGGIGAPIPLWRAQADNAPPPAAAATATAAADAGPSTRECRPYTSSTTLTGRGLRVEGIACRGNDGQWRLVSEVPLR
jgi:hypothetical protein